MSFLVPLFISEKSIESLSWDFKASLWHLYFQKLSVFNFFTFFFTVDLIKKKCCKVAPKARGFYFSRVAHCNTYLPPGNFFFSLFFSSGLEKKNRVQIPDFCISRPVLFSGKKMMSTYLWKTFSFIFSAKSGRKKKTRPTYLHFKKVLKNDGKKKPSAFGCAPIFGTYFCCFYSEKRKSKVIFPIFLRYVLELTKIAV